MYQIDRAPKSSMEKELTSSIILVIEENLSHACLIQETLKNRSLPHQVLVFQGGSEALSYLHRIGEDADVQRPHLIFLNLNLCYRNGQKILAEIKENPKLRRIPIVVFTDSTSEQDIFRSYELQGNCYVVKAADEEQLLRVIKTIEKFWLEIVTLPLE